MGSNEKQVDSFIRRHAMRLANDRDTEGKVRRYIAVAIMGLLILVGGAFFVGQANAHSGGVSPKDQCHKLNVKVDGKKRAIERHWHKAPEDAGGKKTVRAGPCIKDAGETYRLAGHALCADERIAMLKADETYGANYRRIATDFKHCVLALDAPEPAPRN